MCYTARLTNPNSPTMPITRHLDDDDLARRVREAVSPGQKRRWQVIFLRQTQPLMPVSAVAKACGVAYRTVTQWTWGYNKHGPDWLAVKRRGGRRRGLMSPAKERAFMESLLRDAEGAAFVTTAKIRAAAQRRLGREVSRDYAYDLLRRHGWRKVKPHTRHPKSDPQAREDFKKNSRRCWLPPPKAWAARTA